MNDLLSDIRSKAAALKTALTAHQTANTNHHQAWTRWNEEAVHTETANHAIVHTGEIVDVTRDEVIAKAQSLLETVHVLLTLNPTMGKSHLAQKATSMQSALDREVVAFTAYSKASGMGPFSLKAQDVWAAAKEACVQAAFYLMFEASHLPLNGSPETQIPESQLPTDLDGSPDWKSATTPEERDRILYENRKKTLGSKRAGEITYAIPRAIAKRRSQSSD